MKILVAGATGYIGGRLVPRLLDAGHDVRCVARRPGKLDLLPWRDRVEVVQGDVLEPQSLKEAADGCDAAFYLVHAMEAGSGFEDRDRIGAENFREAADAVGIQRIVYLGGLGPDDTTELSVHLSSRHEVGKVLAAGDTSVTELRAAVIIGSGSLSFEMLRYLTEVLPIMTTPRWVRTKCQPVAVKDILEALLRAVEEPSGADRIVEIGGPDVLTYQEMMQIYAQEAGLRKRVIIPVPVLSPGLSSLWVGLVTPLPPSIARPLVDSLKHEVIVKDEPDDRFDVAHTPYREAVRRALDRRPEAMETRWTDAGELPALPAPGDPVWSGGTVLTDVRVVPTDAAPCHIFWAFSRIGGNVGYYGLNWAWRLRGVVDQLVGGVGLRRGRRHPEELREGDAVDFWRVEQVEREKRLRLHAEMRLPGEAWLEWEIIPTADGADLVQTALFRPRGLLGRLYWYAMVPAHSFIFPRMAYRIAATAEERGYACP